MADKRISQLIERTDIANNDVLPIVASGATTTNKVTISTIQEWMQDNLDVGVTSVGITIGSTGTDINVTGSPITTSGNITINIPTASATNRGLLSSSDWSSFNSKLSSVGLTMPSAFTVSNSPLTANGTIAVTGAGTVAQYIRGDGSLADFPEAGGGGASVSYYLNGSVSQGTIGGVAYLEMSKTPILGAGTNFTINANGYIASFITDAGDPNLLLIPGGNWNFETYFAASSGGGTPSFYVELYKVSGSTATLVASNSANPELIAFGTTTTAYFSSLAVPATTLTLTDRLALRYYVTHAGRTITLHTENSNLCQVITTFTTGLTALNGLTAQVQNFATGTSGTDFNISSSSATHTFNLPDASASNRGAVTTGTQTFAGYKIFNGTIGVNNDLQLATQGTALNTFIKNINSTGLTSIGSNGFGFNNANNIYFSGSSKGGGVFAFSNSGTQTYTLQDASGTLAFTSDLGNYIQGVGTADSIPKFTAARTLANSAIRDTTSTVVISKNVSVDNGASQAINLTPASGGTTNRIETTGTLPLAIITSGSSITLAAGGVTPQFTLASTGAVTLTGALNGTSASFTGDVGVVKSSPLYYLQNSTSITTGTRGDLAWYNSSVSTVALIRASATTDNVGTSLEFYTRPAAGSLSQALTLASTGAATFSSSVTANGVMSLGNDGTYGSGYKTLGLTGNTNGTHRIFAGTSDDFHIAAATGRGIIFWTDGVTGAKMSILPSGNVGIGTASPSELLDIRGANRDQSSGEFNQVIYSTTTQDLGRGGSIGFGGTTNGTSSITSFGAIKGLKENGDGGNTAGALAFYSRPNGGAMTERMRITSGGNVGIGTASPANLLHLAGSSATPSLRLGSISAGFHWDIGRENATTGDFVFNQSISGTATERMRITSGGYLKASNNGVYFNSVGNYNEFNNSLNNTITMIVRSQGTSNGSGILAITPAADTSEYFFGGDSNGTIRVRIYTNGNIQNQNNSYGSLSDIKLKENIEDATPKLDDLMKVKVRNYNLIGDDKKQIGVIAQELEEVFPAMIDESEDFEEVEVPQVDEEGNEVLNEEGEVQTTKERVSKGTTTKSVKYSVFVPMLIKAMQEQQEQIKSLTEQVEALKSQING